MTNEKIDSFILNNDVVNDTHDLVDIDCIVSDPSQSRKTFLNIEELANSIELNGLLQNLVVRRPEPGEPADKLVLIAGERRFRAIKLLISRDKFPSAVMCLIKGVGSKKTDNIFSNLSENEGREPIPPWRSGFKYQELLDYGFTQSEIAARVSSSNSKVSCCLQIARGIHPNIIPILDRVPNSLAVNKLLRISKMLDSDFQPSLELQQAAVYKALSHKKRKTSVPRDNIPEKERVVQRYFKLKYGRAKVPVVMAPFFDSVMKYLSGETVKLVLDSESIDMG